MAANDFPTLGWQVADWIETLLCHGPGDVEGQPIELDDEFLAVIARAYELTTTGRRKVRRYILSRSKGRAKSELAGMLTCVEALGPVRFDHLAKRGETAWWGYQYEQGEPVGRRVVRPFVRCLATEETQAGNTYENVLFMLTEEDAAITSEITGIDAGLTRIFLPGGGEIRPSTASNASKDGGKETFAVFDETHLYVLPELRGMHNTVRRNLRKRRQADGWSLETTTMYEQGAGSVAETTFEAMSAVKARPDVVFDHREGPDPSTFDWDDDRQLKAALVVAYGPAAEWMDLDGIVNEIRDPETDPADAVRYFLNRAQSPATDVLDLKVWDRLEVDASLEEGEAVTVGFDGSERDDSTAITIVRARDGLTVNGGLWERPAGIRLWEVPRREVNERVDLIHRTYKVIRQYCDERYWETDIDMWRDKYGEKVVLRVPASDTRLAKMSDRWDSLIRATLQALAAGESIGGPEQICHDGDADLRRHIGNARRARIGGRTGKARGWKPAKKKATRKIDLLSGAMLAHEARGDALAAGELANEPDYFVSL